MKLNNLQRVQLKEFLPQNGTMSEITSIMSIHKKLDFTDEETEKMGIKMDGTLLTWKLDEEKTFKFTFAEKTILINALHQMDAGGTLRVDFYGLYLKIKQLEN